MPIDTLPFMRHLPFAQVPESLKVRSFGVSYVRIIDYDGAELYVTAEGWPLIDYLLPENWYLDSKYLQLGYRLPGGTGMVYHVAQKLRHQRPVEMVVKFSRLAQEVPLFVADPTVALVNDQFDLSSASFNSPFEEFALLEQLRAPDAHGKRILTKRPLAIYSPADRVELWRTGRTRGRFVPHEKSIVEDQDQIHADPLHAVKLDIQREYVVLFSWLAGRNAEDFCRDGVLPEAELLALTARVTSEIAAKGFRVLDNKPRHYILRQRGDGSLLRDRHGQLVYGLVDFELLERIPSPA